MGWEFAPVQQDRLTGPDAAQNINRSSTAVGVVLANGAPPAREIRGHVALGAMLVTD